MTDMRDWTEGMRCLYLRALYHQQQAADAAYAARYLTGWYRREGWRPRRDGHALAVAASEQREAALHAFEARASLFYLLDLQRWQALDVTDVIDGMLADLGVAP